ncbi:MAG: benzoyl-CoA-dihydrodiol lyase [Rickettsiales bacterium]|nr:benzoyl-CoA-dihydrodiol lyase [Rickettsiales bacterium]
MEPASSESLNSFSFQTHPSRYKHLKLSVDGAVATLTFDIQEEQGLKEGYTLKLNSYDLGVDIELADAVQRLRFEHPEVAAVVVTSALDGMFSSGANIFMLGSSTHAFKVNFCKYTNETRLYIEDAAENSGQTYIAALNGTASGGGYELPLACSDIYLVDDRRSAVALPEVPYLGVLPGTGGLTRVVDKRMVRRDLADIFSTLAEGIKGKRAVKWGLVDAVFPSSVFMDKVYERASAVAAEDHDNRDERTGIKLGEIRPEIDDEGIRYQHVSLQFGPVERTATVTITVPESLPAIPADPTELGDDWWALKAYRELDDLLLRLRFHYPEIGLLLMHTRGPAEVLLELDAQLVAHSEHWFVREVLLHMKRVLKRLDVSAKSIFALMDEGSCFNGSLFEVALSADRSYMLDEEGVSFTLSELNFGRLPMGNGLTRLQTRFLAKPEHAAELESNRELLDAEEAEGLGLVTAAFDDIDWEDEIRLAVEERASMSPDALTGMEANLRFAGPETLETKIFGRLSAWQNWIFQRPNAVGEKGALTLYGQPESAVFDYRRT